MKDFQRHVIAIGSQKPPLRLNVEEVSAYSRVLTTKIIQQKNAQEKVLKLNLVLLADDVEYMSLQKVPLVGGGKICRINMPIRFSEKEIKKLMLGQGLALCDFLGFPQHSDEFNFWVAEISKEVEIKQAA